MSYILDIRLKLTESETAQWEDDIARIRPVLGQVPRRQLILQAVHVLAWMIDRLDIKALVERLDL